MADVFDESWNPLLPGTMSDEDWRKLEANLKEPNYLDSFHFDPKKNRYVYSHLIQPNNHQNQ